MTEPGQQLQTASNGVTGEIEMTDEQLVDLAGKLGFEFDARLSFNGLPAIRKPGVTLSGGEYVAFGVAPDWLLTWPGVGAVMEEMRVRGWNMRLYSYSGSSTSCYFSRPSSLPEFQGKSTQSAPGAICLSALAALQGEHAFTDARIEEAALPWRTIGKWLLEPQDHTLDEQLAMREKVRALLGGTEEGK